MEASSARRTQIWTDDAAAVDGFENLVGGELDFAPTIVLRFERNRLLDVSSEFRIDFDEKIAKLRAQLDSQDLRDFKNSDGKLASTARFSAEQLHRLRGVKIKVLEIAWSYLYSGREPEAWLSLADMWPDCDVQRLRTAMLTSVLTEFMPRWMRHPLGLRLAGKNARGFRYHSEVGAE